MRFIDLLLHDIHGVDRGKRVDVASARSTFANGLLLPGSMFALDVPGGTVQATGLGFDEGDADRPCMPIPGTLVDGALARSRRRAGAGHHARARWPALRRRSAPCCWRECWSSSRRWA